MVKRIRDQRREGWSILIVLCVSILGSSLFANERVSADAGTIVVRPESLSLGPNSSPPGQVSGPLWQNADEFQLQARGVQGMRVIIPTQYRLVSVDLSSLDTLLSSAPQSGSAAARNASVILPLPLPDGTMQDFRIEAFNLMEPALAAKFPEITTYRGWGIDDPTATIRLDRTPAGFHGLILSATGSIYIDPYSTRDLTHYISYYRSDYDNIWQKERFDTVLDNPNLAANEAQQPSSPESTTPPDTLQRADTGPVLRTYRLALAATGEYTAFHGGTVVGAQSAIVTTINRVSGIYEREVSVNLTLVDNTNIIYTDSASDPYDNFNGVSMLTQNQLNLDTVIGDANYDIGHVFSTGGGGVAYLGVVCETGSFGIGKAGGVTGLNNPVGDSFDVDFVAHEMGHQFDAEHTFNASASGQCFAQTRSSLAAYEPGGGTTIMAYAGICTNQNIQNNSDDYFHAKSLSQISDFVSNPATGGSCGTTTNTGNSAPVVDAGDNFTIPAQTPFTLSGSATDDGGQTLTYIWEQYDLGSAWSLQSLPNTDVNAARPIFRSYAPQTSATRTFPTLDNILDKTYQNDGESLPTRTRTMQFRLTTRDQLGGVSFDTALVTVNGATGPFRVTTPSGTDNWPLGTDRLVTWDVANSDASPVNCSNVDILLSDDDGQTFSATLLAGTANDGVALVTTPAVEISRARIKVVCSDNIFFDISASGLSASGVVGQALLDDDHEGANNWTTQEDVGTNVWMRNTDGGASGDNYWFVADVTGVTDSRLTSSVFNVLNSDVSLIFAHRYDLEASTFNSSIGYDGGVVEINVNDGGWQSIDPSHFTKNGYNRTIDSSASAIDGQPAFSGDSELYLQSIVDLSSYVTAGDTAQIRFRQVTDNTGSDVGWYVDDVTVYLNNPIPPVTIDITKTVSSEKVKPGDWLTYTITAKNTSVTTARDVVLTDTLPVSTTLISGGVDFGSTAFLPGSGSLLTWQTGISLTTNQAITYTFVVLVDPNFGLGTLTNTAYISAANMANNQASNSVTTFVSAQTTYLPLIRR
ncbi:MAG: reprolysin-like metallopeptidase [Chloroflexota bacterium]